MNYEERCKMQYIAYETVKHIIGSEPSYPFNVDFLLRKLNGKVKLVDTLHKESIVINKEDKSFVIYVSDMYKDYDEKVKRFCMATNIASAMIFTSLINSASDVYEYSLCPFVNKNFSSHKNIAREFAIGFLMPEHVFINKTYEFTEDKKIDVDSLSDWFGIREDEIIYRGKQIDLFRSN